MVAVEELPDDDEPSAQETSEQIEAAQEETKSASSPGDDQAPKKVNGVDPHERFAEGVRQKEQGKEAYAQGNYEEAVDAWCMARGTFKHIVERELFKDNPEKLEEVKQLQLVVNLNLAQGYLKNKEFHQAVTHANKVLEVEPQNEKALYRKAAALIDASSYAEAKDTLDRLLEVDPSNASAKQMLNDVARKSAASAKSRKKAAQKMMAGMQRDPRTELTHKEYLFEKGSQLLERALSIDIATHLSDLRRCKACRRRKQS
mmetsp:Transcript_117601/g.183726  ORF Transcript_117601/g.183726 Transcript_117601/m.183726 type:complete len:259 (-) Transcript_117601:48-824(-)